MSELFPRIADRVPAVSRALVERLLSEPLRPPADLAVEVEAYLEFIREFSASHPDVDAIHAERLTERCRALIERTRSADEADRRLVQAACLYFVAIEGDLDADGGFVDDEAVIAAVEAALR